MKKLIDAILAGDKDFSQGEEVKIIGNNGNGHIYPVGSTGFITVTNQQIGFKQYQLRIPAININGGYWISEVDIEKIDVRRDKSDTIRDLRSLIDILDSVSDDEFSKIDSKKMNKRYKSYKFLTLFNNAKTEAEKLSVLEDILD